MIPANINLLTFTNVQTLDLCLFKVNINISENMASFVILCKIALNDNIVIFNWQEVLLVVYRVKQKYHFTQTCNYKL